MVNQMVHLVLDNHNLFLVELVLVLVVMVWVEVLEQVVVVQVIR